MNIKTTITFPQEIVNAYATFRELWDIHACNTNMCYEDACPFHAVCGKDNSHPRQDFEIILHDTFDLKGHCPNVEIVYADKGNE